MQSSTAESTIRKLARITAKPGGAQALREALVLLERDTRNEAGCIEFSFFQAISDESRFVLLEAFVSPAALQEHLALPHAQAFFALQLIESVQAVDVPA